MPCKARKEIKMDQTIKDRNEILDQVYVSAEDLEILMPGLSYGQRLKLIKEIRNEMKQKNLYLPQGRTLVASTK